LETSLPAACFAAFSEFLVVNCSRIGKNASVVFWLLVFAGASEAFSQQPLYMEALRAEGLPATDWLYQFYEGSDHTVRKKRYLDTFRGLRPGVSQMIIHCGTDDSELQAITASHFLRGDDTRIFSDPAVKTEIEGLGIELLSWTQLRAREGRP